LLNAASTISRGVVTRGEHTDSARDGRFSPAAALIRTPLRTRLRLQRETGIAVVAVAVNDPADRHLLRQHDTDMPVALDSGTAVR
jgi:hypothetical protein